MILTQSKRRCKSILPTEMYKSNKKTCDIGAKNVTNPIYIYALKNRALPKKRCLFIFFVGNTFGDKYQLFWLTDIECFVVLWNRWKRSFKLKWGKKTCFLVELNSYSSFILPRQSKFMKFFLQLKLIIRINWKWTVRSNVNYHKEQT